MILTKSRAIVMLDLIKEQIELNEPEAVNEFLNTVYGGDIISYGEMIEEIYSTIIDGEMK
jgi:hypothetical protein